MGLELARGDPSGRRLPLIRISHIFAAAVREILELKLLHDLSDDGLTPRQLELLRFISLSRHHIDDIARFLDISAPAATKAVDQLERRGLVSRGGCDGDRRLRVLCCSEKGKQLMERCRAAEGERLDSVLATFSDGELDALSLLLERYAVALISSASVRDVPCLRCSGYFDPNCPLQLIHSRCPYQERGDQ
jgi:DNA-binding MarR family transcriptional regulator